MRYFFIVVLVLLLSANVFANNGSGESLGELSTVIDKGTSLINIFLYDIFPIVGIFIVILGWLSLRKDDGKEKLARALFIVGGVALTPRIVNWFISFLKG